MEFSSVFPAASLACYKPTGVNTDDELWLRLMTKGPRRYPQTTIRHLLIFFFSDLRSRQILKDRERHKTERPSNCRFTPKLSAMVRAGPGSVWEIRNSTRCARWAVRAPYFSCHHYLQGSLPLQQAGVREQELNTSTPIWYMHFNLWSKSCHNHNHSQVETEVSFVRTGNSGSYFQPEGFSKKFIRWCEIFSYSNRDVDDWEKKSTF